MTETNRWIVTIEEDPETKELVIPFSPDMLAQVGWDFGDIILWKDNQNGSFTLTKQEVTDGTE
jgi:hypothetical protein